MRKAACIAVVGLLSVNAARAEEAPPAPAPALARTVLVAVATLGPALDRVERLASVPGGSDPFDRLKGAIRHRFASAMVDLYPVADSGLHFSVGTRFFRRQNIARDEQMLTDGLLYVPRMPRGGFGQRGFRRATAAATMGYGRMIGSNFMLGLEGGTLLGRIVQPLQSGARLAGLPGGRANESGVRLNPVLALTLGCAF